MQFEMNHKVGTNYSTVKFIGNYLSIDYRVRDKFIRYFQRIGGELTEGGNWVFPAFVTSQVIQEIINNTCFVCGGLMQDSTALQNTNVSFDDFGEDSGSRGSTQSRVGQAKQITVRKCCICGHSHT